MGAVRQRCAGQPLALCLALTKGSIVCAVRTDDCLVLFPVHPLTRARYRAACTPSRTKADPTDAARPLAWLGTHRAQRQPLTPHSPTRRALEPRVAHRRRGVGATVRLTTRLTRTLQNSCPHALQWVQDKATLLCGDLRSRWPTRKAVQRARRSTLETCCREHPGRSADVLPPRIDAIKAAPPLPPAAGSIAPHVLRVQTLVSPRRVTLHALQAFDQAIAQRAQRHPDFPLCQTLPGAGPVCAPRLLVAFGAPRERSACAAALQPCAGIAPVTERRGQTSWVHWRFPCPPFRRQTCVAWAAAAIRHAFWARVSDHQQRAKGNAHQAAVRALACKWLRMLFRCWQERTPYKESVYLQALTRRGSALLHKLTQAS